MEFLWPFSFSLCARCCHPGELFAFVHYCTLPNKGGPPEEEPVATDLFPFCSLCYFLKVFCTLELDSVFCVASPISDFDGRSLWKDTSWSAGVAFIKHRVFWEVEMAEASREEWFVWMDKDREGKVRGKDRRGARAKEGRKGGGLVGTCLGLEFSPQADKPVIPLFNIFISCLWRNWNIAQSPLIGFFIQSPSLGVQ